MEKIRLESLNKKHLSRNDKSEKEIAEFKVLEDRTDLSLLGLIASEGTKKGFERAKRTAHEIIIVQNEKLIRKRTGKPNQIISKLEQRQVIIGKTTSLNIQNKMNAE